MLKRDDLVKSEETLEQRRAFLKLPLAERQQLLSQQAEEAARYYKSEQGSRKRKPGRVVTLSSTRRKPSSLPAG